MLRVLYGPRGFPVPEFLCEACGKPITPGFPGMVQFAGCNCAAASTRYYFLHTAPECQDLMRQKAGQMLMSGPSEDLPDFLVRLAASIGLMPESFACVHRQCWEEGLINDDDSLEDYLDEWVETLD